MKRTIFFCLIMLLASSCKEENSRFGTCEIFYLNLQPSAELSVKVTDQNSMSLRYNITSASNTILLPLEAGGRYIIQSGETRIDSIYNIRFLWSDNNVVYYSFMFDNLDCDMYNNQIRIDL